ncbi:hypothetical protein HCN44_005764 [Aphidius gifuensis]|uniref:Odorant receptor n=1 Tax=Aphidius gifuensis TaxID=684658 RepID=A0A834XT57_APHGI|nr:hypothetical protein HCN44_005764 [Aphidius gifuensis]
MRRKFTRSIIEFPFLIIKSKLNLSFYPNTPFNIGFSLNITNPIVSEFVGLCQLVSYFIGSLTHGCYNSFFLNMVLIICTHVTVLIDRYKKMIDNYLENRKNFPKIYNSKECLNIERKIMKKFIHNHLEILKLSNSINKIFSIVIFLQFAYFPIIICLFAYFASTVEPFSDLFIALFHGMVNITLQVAACCFASSELTIQFEKLSDTLYEVDWVDFHIKTKRSMIIIMMKTSKPFIFECGKLFRPSRETLTNVCIIYYK